jgi:cytochrome c1
VYIAGRLTNAPEHLIDWIVDPRAADPRTAMPVTGVSRSQARHIAAYLLSLP